MSDAAQGLDRKQLWLLEGLIAEGIDPKQGSRRDIAPRVSEFIDRYCVHLNGAKAATEAGYSERSARQIASKLLTNVDIRREIARRLDDRRQAGQITVEGVLDQLRRLAHADIRTMYRADGTMKPVGEWPDDMAARVASIETEETLTVNGLELEPEQLQQLRAALRGVGLELDRIGEVNLVRVVKFKVWDPARAIEMLGRYLKMLTPEKAPEAPPLMQIPAEAFRRRRLPGDDAVPVPQIVDGRAEHLPADGSHPTPSERRSRDGGE